MIWLKAVLKAVVLPPMGPLLLAAIGLWMSVHWPRAGRIVAWTGVLSLLVLSTPIVAFLLLRLLDASPIDLAAARNAQGIVILGGGIRRHAAEYDGDTVGRLTLERVRYGARLARLTNLPILVSGGSVLGGEPEAVLMQRVLEQEFGISVRWTEPASRNTEENAARSAEILAREHITTIVLVTHAFDMPRAKAEFVAHGLDVVPAPTGVPTWKPGSPLDMLPNLASLQSSYFALYELIANLVRWHVPKPGAAMHRNGVHSRVDRGAARPLSRSLTYSFVAQPVVYR